MAAKSSPSDVSRDNVQVVLRDNTSISPDCRAVNRSFAVSGTNLTLVGSLKIAAAMARQKSTSKPIQLPCGSGRPKPASVPFVPQINSPRLLIVASVSARAACVTKASTVAKAIAVARRFIIKPFRMGDRVKRRLRKSVHGPLPGQHLRTIALQRQGLTTACYAEVMAQLSVRKPALLRPSARSATNTGNDGQE